VVGEYVFVSVFQWWLLRIEYFPIPFAVFCKRWAGFSPIARIEVVDALYHLVCWVVNMAADDSIHFLFFGVSNCIMDEACFLIREKCICIFQNMRNCILSTQAPINSSEKGVYEE